MSCYITYLVIKDAIEIDDPIDYKQSDGFLFFRFDDDFCWLIKNARDFESTAIYFDYIKSRDDFYKQSPLAKLINIIEDHQIKDFILEHYSEFGDVPADHFFMMVSGGNIIHDSLVFDEDDESSEKNSAEMHQYKKTFGLENYWFSKFI